MAICRFDLPEGKKDLRPLSWCVDEESGKTEWRWKGAPRPRPLYGAHLVKTFPKEDVFLVVEGEKTCDAARKIFPTTCVVTWPGGAEGVKSADWEPLKRRKIVIWPDADVPGQKAASSIAEVLIDIGVESVSVVNLPEGLPEGWDLADEVPEGIILDPKILMSTAVPYTPSGDAVIDELNRKMALVLIGDKATIVWEKQDPIKGRIIPTYTSISAMSSMLANKKVPVGKAEVPAFNYWMEHEGRRTYSGVVFQPGDEVPDHYNLWRGFSVVPEANGDWSILREHIEQNVCNNDPELYKWVVGWFAQMFQQPKIKPGTSLALRGKQGVGKTKLGEVMGHLIRDNYVYVDDSRYVVGNFNSHMGHALLMQADEGFFAGDPRHTGRLKGLITSETNRIEPKGKDSFEIMNYMRLMVTSNSDWIVPTALEERRFAILDVGESRMQDRAYFKALDEQMAHGGYEGLLHYLLNFDLSTVDVGVIPKTIALSDQKELSMDPVQRWWMERLQDSATVTNGTTWEPYIYTEEMYQDFIKRCITWGIYRRPSETQFVRDLKSMAPDDSFARVRRKVEIMGDQGMTQMRSVYCYKIPNLEEARRSFETRIGKSFNWPDDDMVKAVTPLDDERLI